MSGEGMMKTTVEIPDELFRQAKAKAALEGIRFRDLVARGLRLAMDTPPKSTPPRRTVFPLIKAAPDTRPLTASEVADALVAMDDDEATKTEVRHSAMSEASQVTSPLVGIIMGSSSDWETMRHAVETLEALGVPYEMRVVSAHRTPDLLFEYAATAEARGLEVLAAGAGGAAHLPGMAASKTVLPVLGVPVQSKALNGLDSLLSIAQMPAGIPVGTLAIGRAGAVNAALLAAAMLGARHPAIRAALRAYREAQTQRVLDNPDPRG
jgi:5-(carboxyamino)imidazole ribonucleotide mutase